MKLTHSIAALAVTTIAANAATTVADYAYSVGSESPTTQGFTETGGGGTWNSAYDTGSAWQINDGTSSGLTFYQANYDGSTVAGDWTASMDLVIKDDLRNLDGVTVLAGYHSAGADRQTGNAVWIENATQGYHYIARLIVNDVTGDLSLNDGTTTTLLAAGFGFDSAASLEVAYTGGVATASVNGGTGVVLASSGTGATDRFIFGHYGGAFQGSADYTAASFTAIPEPTSTLLLGLGSLGLLLRRRR